MLVLYHITSHHAIAVTQFTRYSVGVRCAAGAEEHQRIPPEVAEPGAGVEGAVQLGAGRGLGRGRELVGAVGQSVDRETFARVGNLHNFVVEVEAGGARELDVLVASPNLEKAPLAYWFEKTAVGFVVMGDLIGEYMD